MNWVGGLMNLCHPPSETPETGNLALPVDRNTRTSDPSLSVRGALYSQARTSLSFACGRKAKDSVTSFKMEYRPHRP